jgi:hypothetical protein
MLDALDGPFLEVGLANFFHHSIIVKPLDGFPVLVANAKFLLDDTNEDSCFETSITGVSDHDAGGWSIQEDFRLCLCLICI